MRNIIKDINLADAGERRIEWARRHMPVLENIKSEFAREKPLNGINITACLHVTVETANLIRVLSAGGANVALAGSNPLSTQDDVAAALANDGISVCAFHGESDAEYHACIEEALKIGPHVTLDDGADVIATVHNDHPEYLSAVIGGCE